MTNCIDMQKLAGLVTKKRGPIGVRAAAIEAGVSPATLSRVENNHMPTLVTFAKLCKWVERDPREFLGAAANAMDATFLDVMEEKLISVGPYDGAWAYRINNGPDSRWIGGYKTPRQALLSAIGQATA